MSYKNTYLNSCQLILEQIQINTAGVYYFIWSKGKRYIQSKKYQLSQAHKQQQSEQQNEQQHNYQQPGLFYCQMQEKLGLNLKLYSKQNSKYKKQLMQEKNTHLALIRAKDDHQICSFVLNVQSWSQSSQQKQLQIKSRQIQGTLIILVRRQIIMELDNFQKFPGQIQQSEQQGRQNITTNNIYMAEVSHQKLIALQQEIDDKNYLLQKLKKDRNTTLARNECIQLQSKHIKTNIQAELKRLQNHYKAKIDSRESIYREQIQQIISTFNENSRVNYRVLKNVIQQNQELYAQLVNNREIYQNQMNNLKEQHIFRIQELQQQKLEQSKQITNHINTIEEYKYKNESLLNDLEKERQENATMQEQNHEKQQQHENKQAQYEQRIDGLLLNIKQLEQKLQKKQQDLMIVNNRVREHQQNEQQLNQLIKAKDKAMAEQLGEKFLINEELNRKTVEVESFMMQNDHLKNQIQRIRDQYKLFIDEAEKKQKNFEERQQDLIKNYQDENEKVMSLIQQKHQIQLNVHQLQSSLVIKNEQINYLTHDMERMKQIKDDLQKNMLQMTQAYDDDAKKLTNRLDELQLENQSLRIQNDEYHQEITDIYDKHNAETNQVRHQFEQLKLIREQQFQNQLEAIKQKKDQIQLAYTIKNQQLERQIDQLSDEKLKMGEQLNQFYSQNLAINRELSEARQQVLNHQKQTISYKQLLATRDIEYKQMIDQVRQGYEDVLRQGQYKIEQPVKKNALEVPKQGLFQNMVRPAVGPIDDSNDYRKKIQKLQQKIAQQQANNAKQRNKLQEQWQQIRKIYQLLTKQQEELRLRHERLNVFTPFKSQNQQIRPVQPVNFLKIPKLQLREHIQQNLQKTVAIPLSPTKQQQLSKRSQQNSMQQSDQEQKNNQISKKRVVDFKQTIDNLTEQVQQIHHDNSSVEAYKQLYLQKIKNLQQQAAVIDQEHINQHKFMMELKGQLQNAQKIIIEYNEREKQMLAKFEDYEIYIENLEMKIEEYNFEEEAKKKFEHIQESKIYQKSSEPQIQRVNSKKKLKTQGSLQGLLKRKPTLQKFSHQKIPTSPKQSQRNIRKNIVVHEKGVQTENTDNPNYFQIRSNASNSFNQIQELSFKDLQFNSDPNSYQGKVGNKKGQVIGKKSNQSAYNYEQQGGRMTQTVEQQQKKYQRILQMKERQLKKVKQEKNNEIQSLKEKLTKFKREKQSHQQQFEYDVNNNKDDKKNNEQIQRFMNEINQLKLRNRELYDESIFMKQELKLKSNLQESRIIQYENRQLETKKSMAIYDQKISTMKSQYEEKQQKKNEKIQAITMQLFTLKHGRQLLETENSSLRKQIQKLRNNETNAYNTNNTGSTLVSYLQQQVDDTNKKLLQYTKDRNKLEITKQNLEDQLISAKNRYTNSEKVLAKQNQELSQLRKENDELLRNVNKKKRQNGDLQDELVKLRQQVKKYQNDIKNLSNTQNLFKSQRKNMQDQLQMEENYMKKQSEFRKLNKQMVKNRQQFEQQIEKLKSALENKTSQYHHLELQAMKLKKLAHSKQYQADQLLNHRQNQQNRIRGQLQQLNKKHSQKLKLYIHQITNIKSILEETELDMQDLRIENASLLEELEALQANYQEKQAKLNKIEELTKFYQQETAQYKNINSQLQNNLKSVQGNYLQSSNDLIDCKQKLEKEQLISLKKSQKLEQYQILNEKYIYELKNLKIKLNDLNHRKSIDQNYQVRLQQMQKENKHLLENYTKVNKQYLIYKAQYQYTSQQVQDLLEEFQQTSETSKRQQIAKLKRQLENNYEIKTSDTENELLKLYNQNVQNGGLLQHKQNQYMILSEKYHEIEFYPQKYQQQKTQNSYLQQETQLAKSNEKLLKKQLQSLKYAMKQQQRIIGQLSHLKQLLRSQKKQLQTIINKIEGQNLELQTENQFLKIELTQTKAKQSDQQQFSSGNRQQQDTKILALQLQNQRVLERQKNLQLEYKNKITKLEVMIEQLKKQRKQIQGLLIRKNGIQILQINNKLSKLQQDYNQINGKFKTTSLSAAQFEQENRQLRTELGDLREQIQEDQQLYIMEVNNLKNTIADMQQLYNHNVSNLEEQLATLNKQLTQQRLHKNELLRGSRYKSNSYLRESEAERKYDDRLKNKDKQIEELTNKIFKLQQMMENKGSYQGYQSQKQLQYHKMLQQTNRKLDLAERTMENEQQKHLQQKRLLKKEISRQKQGHEQLLIQIQQLSMTRQSIETELKTVKHLYKNLQQQSEKHQKIFAKSSDSLANSNHMINGSHSRDQMLESKLNHIIRLEEQIVSLKVQLDNASIDYNHKEQECGALSEELRRQKLANVRRLSQYDEAITWKDKQLNNIKQLREAKEKLESQNKKLNLRINYHNTAVTELEQKLSQIEQQFKNLQHQNKQQAQQLKSLKDKCHTYNIIEQKCYNQHKCSIQKFIVGGEFYSAMIQRDQQLQSIQEELEQLKFVQNQKLLDYEELQQKNFELQLQNQDYAMTIQQLEHLRNITDKLEQEKKSAIFREQAIRVRLGNLLNTQDGVNSMRQSISAILDQDIYS